MSIAKAESLSTVAKYSKEKLASSMKRAMTNVPVHQRQSPLKMKSCCGPKGLLSSQSPKSMIATMWFVLMQHFGLQGCQEHHDMYVEDFSFSKDDNGVEYITYKENRTKTCQGGLHKKRRVVQPKMFATGGPRCPVNLLKTFLSHRPQEMKNNGPFYLAVIEHPKSQVWYKRQTMGIHSINSFMKSMASQAEIEDKRLTNHSACKTLVKKLKGANQPRCAIIGVAGQTNERS